MNMNMDEMQSAWNSPRNNLPTGEQRRLAEQFTRQMVRRRRFQALWLINTFALLTIATALAARAVATGKAELAQEWALLPLLIAPWMFAIHFLRRHLKPGSPAPRGEVSVADSFRAALSSNRREQSHLKAVGVLFAIVIPLLAVSMQQLHAVGKASTRELTSMAVFFGGVLLLSSAGIAARYFGRVMPQQKRLSALLAELNDQTQS
ncbi:MAG TPA: hypothetical protein VK530_10795 [Candidatus Acidoferrum sp.]|nr:hypothetical protein [Candidatus Acidoferrum sp.]